MIIHDKYTRDNRCIIYFNLCANKLNRNSWIKRKRPILLIILQRENNLPKYFRFIIKLIQYVVLLRPISEKFLLRYHQLQYYIIITNSLIVK